MTESQNLLTEYAERGSEEAFRELVERYIDLVHSTAVRLVGGDAQLAQDVTQTVFIHLYRSARKLSPRVMLGGWLHRDTCYVASKLLRQERRRQYRERQAALMNSIVDHSKANLEQAASILDEAINGLSDDDRTAILLRFFEQRDFRSVGQALNSNEDAARMRVSRALGKLHTMLKRRGVTLSVSALAAGLAGEAVTAAPVGLSANIIGAAIAATAGAGTISTYGIQTLFMTKLKTAIVVSLLAGGMAIPLVLQHRTQVQMQEENHQLRQQIQELAAANETLSNQVSPANVRPNPDNNAERELLKLRGEVGMLRRQAAGAAKQPAKQVTTSPTESQETTPEEYAKQVGIAKMNYTRTWVLAFMLYAEKNQGQLPTAFNQALPFWPQDAKVGAGDKGEVPLLPDESMGGTTQFGLVPDKYDIVFQGSLNTLTNPQNIIVLREKDAWQAPNGGWVRAYAFADGHSEIHKAVDGNFLPWEQQHTVASGGDGSGQ